MKKYYFIIDVAKCWDCNNCFISCLDEHESNDWPGYTLPQPRHGHRWMNVMRKERGQFPTIDVAYRPTPCMHCQDAPCVAVSNGAISKREDGIVLIDPVKAKGGKDLVASCPYGAIYWNEEQDVPQKCTFCAHLLDEGWDKPRCVQACFTGALQVQHLDEEELRALIQDQHLEQLHPEKRTRPNVYYKNLHRFNSCFIAGSVAIKQGDILDCADRVKARLKKDKEDLAEVETDAFGDFRFDGLPENSGEYTLELSTTDNRTLSVTVNLASSTTLDTIVFYYE